VSHVVNYDVPSAADAYVHRIGRTGCAVREGVAITLAEPREDRLPRNIEHAPTQKIELATVPNAAALRARRPELPRAVLRAAQVAVGTLGVMTELELEVTDAYRLREQVGLWPWEEVMDRWEELVQEHRHFGFFWLPTEESGRLYNLSGHGERMADMCYVKIYDEASAEEPDNSTAGRRVDRCYRIYPMVYDPNFHELEYFVALERGPDALRAMRELMLRSLPDSLYPMEVRTVGPDDAYLSPSYRTPTTVISVSGKPGTDYWAYLRSVDALLSEFDARVHWGKLHFLTPERLHALYPEADEFIAVRRELDPQGVFLNDHLRPLLG